MVDVVDFGDYDGLWVIVLVSPLSDCAPLSTKSTQSTIKSENGSFELGQPRMHPIPRHSTPPRLCPSLPTATQHTALAVSPSFVASRRHRSRKVFVRVNGSSTPASESYLSSNVGKSMVKRARDETSQPSQTFVGSCVLAESYRPALSYMRRQVLDGGTSSIPKSPDISFRPTELTSPYHRHG